MASDNPPEPEPAMILLAASLESALRGLMGGLAIGVGIGAAFALSSRYFELNKPPEERGRRKRKDD